MVKVFTQKQLEISSFWSIAEHSNSKFSSTMAKVHFLMTPEGICGAYQRKRSEVSPLVKYLTPWLLWWDGWRALFVFGFLVLVCWLIQKVPLKCFICFFSMILFGLEKCLFSILLRFSCCGCDIRCYVIDSPNFFLLNIIFFKILVRYDHDNHDIFSQIFAENHVHV